jgi:hypothetical protein
MKLVEMTLSTITFAVLVAIRLAQVPLNCSLAIDAFGAKTVLPGPPVNRSSITSPYCTSLNTTCCTADDFNMMYQMWEGPMNNNTLRNNRTTQMTQLVSTVRYLQQAQQAVSSLATQIKNSKYLGDPACMTPANLTGDIQNLGLVTSALALFEQTTPVCWGFTKNLMNSLMCASCDPSFYRFYSQSTGTITISNNECMSFITACGEHIQAMNSIIFYFNIFYRISFCNQNGGFTGFTVPESVFLPDQTIKALTGCLAMPNKDDCGAVCTSQYGYSTMINFEYTNLANITKYANKVKTYFNSTQTATPTKTAILKASTSRRRRRVMQALKIPFLNSLSVSVIFPGVEFSKYTYNNSDGYSDMDLTPVFASAQLMTLGISFFISLLAVM